MAWESGSQRRRSQLCGPEPVVKLQVVVGLSCDRVPQPVDHSLAFADVHVEAFE